MSRNKREGKEKTRKGKKLQRKEGIRKEKGIEENEGEMNWREWRERVEGNIWEKNWREGRKTEQEMQIRRAGKGHKKP